MRTTVDIDSHLLKRLRAESEQRGIPFKELLSGVIRRGLEATAPAAPSRYRCPSFSMGVPFQPYNLDKALTLADSLEAEEIARELAGRK